MNVSRPVWIGVTVALLLVIVFVLVLRTSDIVNVSRPENGLQALPLQDVTFRTYDGTNVSLSEYEGTPMVVNVWATWCPFCVKELPDFAKVQQEFGDSVRVIAINRAEPRDVAVPFTEELGITEDLTLLLDTNDSFYAKIGGFSMPETVFVNAQGGIEFHKRGPMELEEIRERTNMLLK